MAKSKKRYFRRQRKSYRRKRGFPSIASIAAVAGPQVVVNSGQLGTYPAILNAMNGDWSQAAWNFGANEVMAFTGFDVGKGTFNLGPPAITYGMPLVLKVMRRIIGPVRAGPVRLI